MYLLNLGLCAGSVVFIVRLAKCNIRESSTFSKGKKAKNIVLILLLVLFIIMVVAFTIWQVVPTSGIAQEKTAEMLESFRRSM
ncbi:MAG: hypothetical protein ACI4JS_10765 [Oscillospiraceae bacterium]